MWATHLGDAPREKAAISYNAFLVFTLRHSPRADLGLLDLTIREGSAQQLAKPDPETNFQVQNQHTSPLPAGLGLSTQSLLAEHTSLAKCRGDSAGGMASEPRPAPGRQLHGAHVTARPAPPIQSSQDKVNATPLYLTPLHCHRTAAPPSLCTLLKYCPCGQQTAKPGCPCRYKATGPSRELESSNRSKRAHSGWPNAVAAGGPTSVKPPFLRPTLAWVSQQSDRLLPSSTQRRRATAAPWSSDQGSWGRLHHRPRGHDLFL
jgi:hypothetical protein